jgi:chemotaxis protein MotB
MKRYLVLITFSLALLSSCVGKKKHLETVNSLTDKYETQVKVLESNLATANQAIGDMQLSLAERRGENTALTAMQDRLEARIGELEKEIEKMNADAQVRDRSSSQELRAKVAEIAEKERLLGEVRGLLDQRRAALNTIAEEVKAALMEFDAAEYSIQTMDAGDVSINLTEKLVFQPGSTSRLQKNGEKALKKIGDIVVKYPDIAIWVYGHTDNRPVARQSLDNWQYSALRSVTIAGLLIKAHDLNPNQVFPSARSEFSPRASNETAEGRAQNRRIELVIRPKTDDLVREIRRKIAP